MKYVGPLLPQPALPLSDELEVSIRLQQYHMNRVHVNQYCILPAMLAGQLVGLWQTVSNSKLDIMLQGPSSDSVSRVN